MPRAPQTLNAKRIKWIIGTLIATQRKKKRMSQRELAQKAGCSIQELDAYEAGQRNLPIWKLVEMAWALEVHPSYFFSGLECPPKEDMTVEGRPGVQRRSGFTLIELSIVLVIIGLVIGGVLVGQDLIVQAQIRRMVSEKEQLTTAVNAFRLKYNALPGDMTDATALWGSRGTCSTLNTTPTTLTCNGDGNGKVGGIGTTSSWEAWTFWQHLSNAQLWGGIYSGSFTAGTWGQRYATVGVNIPASSAYPDKGLFVEYIEMTGTNSWRWQTTKGGNHQLQIGVIHFVANSGWQFIGSSWLTPSQAYAIDAKYDDGKPGTGSIINNYTANLGSCYSGTLAPDLATYPIPDTTNLTCNIIFTNMF